MPTTTLWPGLDSNGDSLPVYAEDQVTLITSSGAVVSLVQEFSGGPYVLPQYYRDQKNIGRLLDFDPLDGDGVAISVAIPTVEVTNAPSTGKVLTGVNTTQAQWATPAGGGGGSGDVVGPSSAVDNRLARFDSTTGKLIQQSLVAVDDSGNMTGLVNITLSGTIDGRNVSADGALLDALVLGGGTGDVVGPSSATDNRVARFDSTTGKLIQQSAVTIDDSGNLTGVGAVTMTGTLAVTGGLTISGTVDGRDVSADGTTLDGYATSKANRSLTVENDAGTAYTLVLADAQEKLKTFSSSSAKSVTVPPNASVAFAIGAVIPLYQSGSGLLTVVAGSGVTVRPPSGGTLVSAGQYAYLTLLKVATNEWKLTGEAAAA